MKLAEMSRRKDEAEQQSGVRLATMDRHERTTGRNPKQPGRKIQHVNPESKVKQARRSKKRRTA